MFHIDGGPQLLEHIAGQAGGGVERGQAERGNGQDEQRICQALHVGQAGDACEHLGQAVSEDSGRGGVAARGVLAPHEADGAQRDDCQQALDEHAAVADGLRFRFPIQLLGRGAGGDQAMEAGDGAAGDGDEQRGEQEARSGGLVRDGLAGLVDEDLARGGIERGVRGDEARERGDLQVRGSARKRRTHDADDSQQDHAVQQIAGQVVARLQQDPHGGDRRDQDVHAQDDHPRVVIQRQGDAHKRQVVADGHHDDDQHDSGGDVHRAGDVTAARKDAVDDGDADEDHRDHGRLLVGQVRGRLRAVQVGHHGERVSHDGGECGHHQQQRQVCEDAEQLLRRVVDVLCDHDRQRLALMAQRREQAAEVVHGAEEDAADEHPQQHGHPAEHGRLDRAVDGAGAGNGREMMTQHHVRRRGNVVHAVFQFMRRSRIFRIDPPLLRQPSAIEDIADDQDDRSNKEDKQCVHGTLFCFAFPLLGTRQQVGLQRGFQLLARRVRYHAVRREVGDGHPKVGPAADTQGEVLAEARFAHRLRRFLGAGIRNDHQGYGRGHMVRLGNHLFEPIMFHERHKIAHLSFVQGIGEDEEQILMRVDFP